MGAPIDFRARSNSSGGGTFGGAIVRGKERVHSQALRRFFATKVAGIANFGCRYCHCDCGWMVLAVKSEAGEEVELKKVRRA